MLLFSLQRMRNVGLLNAIKYQTMKKPEPTQMTFKAVDFWSTIPVFGILYFGILLSAVILIFEMIVFHTSYRRHKFDKSPTPYKFVT